MAEVAANAVVSVAATPSQDSDNTPCGSQVLFSPSQHGNSEETIDIIEEIISSELLTVGFQQLMDAAETSQLVSIYNCVRKKCLPLELILFCDCCKLVMLHISMFCLSRIH